jgi:hypothetical protein
MRWRKEARRCCNLSVGAGNDAENIVVWRVLSTIFHGCPCSLNIKTSKCGLNQAGAGLKVHYQVLDQFGNPLQVAGMKPLETTTVNGQPTGTVNQPFSTPQITTSSGTFDDDPVGTCFGPPAPTQNLCVNAGQSFSIIFIDGLTYPINTTTSIRECVKGIKSNVFGNPGGTQELSAGTIN